MITSFEITMPNVGSWNGQWTGEKNLHFAFRNLDKETLSKIDGKNYYYNFGDGWGANIKVIRMDSKSRAKIQRRNKGFMGYDWMIDSIINNDKIIIKTS